MKYWDKAWSLVDGCTPCSPGCENCWSAAMAHRFMVEGEPGHRSGVITDENGYFDGTVIVCPDRLNIPLKRKKPTVWAIWNDLFHEKVPKEFSMGALNVMDKCGCAPGWGEKVYNFQFDEKWNWLPHCFLVLTKRPAIMNFIVKEWLRGFSQQGIKVNIEYIYFGLTVCNQQEADEKIPIFLDVPGKKFLSIEPMLGAIDLNEAFPSKWGWLCEIDAVIVGGETGSRARPMHPDWVRSIKDQCATAGVPFFFKQWGANPHISAYDDTKMKCADMSLKANGRLLDGQEYNDLPWGRKGVEK